MKHSKKIQGEIYYFYKINVFKIRQWLRKFNFWLNCFLYFNCYFFCSFFKFQCSSLSLSQNVLFFLSCMFFWIVPYMKIKNSKMEKVILRKRWRTPSKICKVNVSKLGSVEKLAPEAYSGSYQNICQHCFGKVAYF